MSTSRTKRQAATAVMTFTVALGIGFAMQYGDAVAGRWGQDAPITGPSQRLTDVQVTPVAANAATVTTLGIPTVSAPDTSVVRTVTAPDGDVTPPPMIIPTAIETFDAAEAPMIEEALPEPVQPVAPLAEPQCDTMMSVVPTDLAMVDLTLQNACRPDARVAIHHQGMMFNATTDADGALSMTVPALSVEAFYIAAFDDGEGAVAITGVPTLADYDRAVLQWQGEDVVQLHALENGAFYGEEGHIWSGASADMTRALNGEGGFLTQLGEGAGALPLKAQVYTYPSGMMNLDGTVVLNVEVEITEENCGRTVQAQSIQVLEDADPTAVDLTMTLPGCDAVGEFLVLKNMFEDLTLASK